MRFIGIWFNMDREVKRDFVDAKDSADASEKINALYFGKEPPAPCLTVIPENPSSSGDLHGFSMQSQW